MVDSLAVANAVLKITRNDISPAFKRLEDMGKDTTPVMLAMGDVFKSITEGNFSNLGSEYRPAPWPAKKDGSPATLKKSGLLWHSFHLSVTSHTATLSNPTPYAAIHQFGSGQVDERRKKNGSAKMNIPPRPFYPVKDGQLTPAAQDKISSAGMRAVERIAAGK